MPKWLKSNLLLIALLVLDALVIMAHFLLKNKYGFFDLDGEQNLNSTYSGLKLMMIAALALIQFFIIFKVNPACLAARRGKKELSQKVIWILVGLSFIYLGLDELVALHERVGFVLNNLTGLTGFKGASFNWVIYYSPLIIIALIVYVHLLFRLWREDKNAFVFVAIGTFLFLAALTSEFIGGKIVYPRGVLTRDFHLYFIFIILEESLELLGATFFLTGIFRKVSRSFNRSFEIKH